ncbi:MAG: hypothetical protein J0M24_13885 [Verrucomicrobia bacterium]|nr:hypothetical protein [Verrucomicrobiota bacterium]
MNRAQLLGLLFAWCLCLVPAVGQVPPDLIVTPSDPVDPLTAHVINLAVQYPWVLAALALMGSLRIVFKPGMALLWMFVRSTPSQTDDQFLTKVEAHPLFSAFGWLLDMVASIKIDTVRAAVRARQTRSLSSQLSALSLLLLLTGCATYTTTQRDVSPERTIETEVRVRTFWDSDSQLANSKAMQTDKSQSASLGALYQSTTSTNITEQLEILLKLAALLGTKGIAP